MRNGHGHDRQYSQGAFLNLTSFDPGDWRRQLNDLDQLADLDHLEVWLEFQPSQRELNHISDLLEGRSLIMHGPFIGLSLSTNWAQLAEISFSRCRRAVETASYLGCRVVTFHGGIFPGYSGHEEALARLTERLYRLNGTPTPVIAVENLPAKRGASWEALCFLPELEHLAQTTDVHFTLDVGHCLQNNEDPLPFLRQFADRVVNIHLHDGHLGGRSHKRLGTGDLDLEGLLKTLNEARYQGHLTLETIGAEDTAASWRVLKEAETRSATAVTG